MAGTVVIFDFDRTIIDGDSDRWVVTEMGLTQLFNDLRSTLPWTSLMDRMMKELHSRGIRKKDIGECLKKAYLHPCIISAIKSAHCLGCKYNGANVDTFRCDLRIISDANSYFIETILEHHGLLGCFSQVYTNPCFVDEEGRLRIIPFHQLSSSHGCHLCPSNMCKGIIMKQIKGCFGDKKRRIIYIGDGTGDYCPSMKLEGSDFVMARKNYPLYNRILSDPTRVNAQVHAWNSGEELESLLLNLINKLSNEEGTVRNASASSDCFQEIHFSHTLPPAAADAASQSP